ncbi:MAG TPA: iron-containing alcohol dehydrogenase [Anaerolineae bacterium]|nr:iron-containing alcohol dehydrogenase [Anaerolineae bacterium]
MWYFNSPEVVYGEDALSHLDTLRGERAFVVTDPTILKLGFVDVVKGHLHAAGMQVAVFAEVEPEPSLQTVRRGAEVMRNFAPDWIVGLGGGSSMDAAKAMWILYERPELDPAEINPFVELGLRQKARLITIPTTSGTGAEATWGIVLTDTQGRRKLALGAREVLADVAIVDPVLVMDLPSQITADTGMDALTHAVEGYTSAWHNDFCDGLCLKAIQLVFEYLPRAYANGGEDPEAREKMHNGACIAGLGFGNSMAALAHALGHALGGVFHVPHGRAVGLFLPYTIEFAVRGGETRYAEIARFLGLPADDEAEGAASLVKAVRDLARRIDQPLTIRDLGITQEDFEANLSRLVANADTDTQMITSTRVPSTEQSEQLFRYAYEGKEIDF